MPTQMDYVLSLDDAPLHALTNLLALPPQSGTSLPSRRWLSSQSLAIARLPRAVLRPSNLIERLAVKLSESYAPEALPAAAELCFAHRGLHPWVVRGVFGLLSGEVTVRCDRLRRYVSEVGEDRGKGKGGENRAEVAGRVLGVLASVNALWLEEEHFATLFGEQAGPWRKLRKVESGCEACILAAVGARGEVLAALRANLLARTRGGEPRLLRVVESWIGWFEKEDREVLMGESEGMAREVKAARGAVREGGRERRRRKRDGERDGRVSSHGCRVSSEHRRHRDRDERSGRDERDKGDARASSEGRRTPAGTESLRSRDNESPVYEEHIANWYARSEVQLVGEVRKGSIHPAFQPPRAPASQPQSRAQSAGETQTRPTEARAVEPVEVPPASSVGITSILDCYGTDEDEENVPPTDAGSKGDSRKVSWVTCTVHTSQPADHNPPPPAVQIPFLDDAGEDDDSTVVQICASSSVYPSEVNLPAAEPEEPLGYTRGFLVEGREWRRVGDSATRFRDPFAEDRRGCNWGAGAVEGAQVSPRGAGWV